MTLISIISAIANETKQKHVIVNRSAGAISGVIRNNSLYPHQDVPHTLIRYKRFDDALTISVRRLTWKLPVRESSAKLFEMSLDKVDKGLKITAVTAKDMRWPTSLGAHGSDAMVNLLFSIRESYSIRAFSHAILT